MEESCVCLQVLTKKMVAWMARLTSVFEAMVVADRDLFYAAEHIEKSIISLQIEKDGVGLKGVNMKAIVSYRPSWQKVNSMCLNNGNLFLSHAHGIRKINLETCQTSLVVELDNQPCVLTSFGTDILYTNQKKASIWQLSGNGRELRLFAGSDKEDGSMDGPVNECRFKQPMGICAELESVVYVCDAQTNSIKICTKLKECAHFLEATGGLYEAFSVHEKGIVPKRYCTKGIVRYPRTLSPLLLMWGSMLQVLPMMPEKSWRKTKRTFLMKAVMKRSTTVMKAPH